MADLKKLINIYDYLLLELQYDSQNNLLKIISIPVTFQFLINLMIPAITALMTVL